MNRRRRLIGRGDSIVVGLSGGPDSTALLYFLTKLRRKYALKLYAAHLNHGLYPSQAKRYEKICEALCRGLAIPLMRKKISLEMLAKKEKCGLEEAGRLARYRFFEAAAKRTRSGKIATAHTLDDQAETVLMHILRGAGLRGLCGIPCKRKLGRLDVIRPFLTSRKSDLLALLRREGLKYCKDPMNQERNFTRNRVRLKLLPLLEREFNPQIYSHLGKLQSICAEALEILEKKAPSFLAKSSS